MTKRMGTEVRLYLGEDQKMIANFSASPAFDGTWITEHHKILTLLEAVVK